MTGLENEISASTAYGVTITFISFVGSLYIIAKKSISGNSEAEPEDVGQAEA